MRCLTQKRQGRFAFAYTSTRTAASAGRGRFGATRGNCAWPTPGDTTRGRGRGHAEPLNARRPRPVPARPTPGRKGCPQAGQPTWGPSPEPVAPPKNSKRGAPPVGHPPPEGRVVQEVRGTVYGMTAGRRESWPPPLATGGKTRGGCETPTTPTSHDGVTWSASLLPIAFSLRYSGRAFGRARRPCVRPGPGR